MLHSTGRLVLALGAACCALLGRPTPAAGDTPAAPAVSASPIAPAMLDGLEWRLLGPFRSGWSTMAVGVAQQPDTYYSGYAGGGG